ncbi:MAG TPA: hypothetical protein VGR12_05530, partial [Solirubrobacteraceae bacterium]|nr:hypothetical protein [Solirubrobacteraceae bacterium]
IQWVAVVTALQEATHDRFQARVAALLEAVMAIGPGIGFLTGSIITALLSPRVAFAVAGGGVLCVVAIAAAVLARRRIVAPVAVTPDPLQP